MKIPTQSINQRYKALLLIILLPVLLNVNILTGAFQFDDNIFIVDGELSYKIKDMGLLADFLRHGGYFQRSVYWATLAVNYHIGGLNPFGYHLLNILVHILNGALVFFLCERLTPLLPGAAHWRTSCGKNRDFPFSFFSALVFLFLPIQTETTAYISCRSSSLVTFFYLSGTVFFLRLLVLRRDHAPFAKWVPPVLGIAACALMGLGTKKTFFTFPCILLLIFFLHTGLSLRGFIKKHKTLFAVVLLMPILLLCVKTAAVYKEFKGQNDRMEEEFSMERRKGLVGSRLEFMFKKGVYSVFGIAEGYHPEMYSPLSYLLTEVHVVSKYYIGKVLFPFELNLSPDFPIEKGMRLGTIIAALGMALAVYAAWLGSSRQPLALLSALWFFTALLPTSSFVPLFDVASEHHTYIAAPGAAMLLGLFLSRVSSNRSQGKSVGIGLPAALAVLVCFAAAWLDRNADWRTETSLWSDAARKSPNMGRTHHNLGLAYEKSNLFSEALLEYNKVLAIHPAADTYVNIGQVNLKLGFTGKAIQSLHAALDIDPKLALAHYNLGVIYNDIGEWPRAIDSYQAAISFSPNYTEALNNLGEIHLKQNQLEKAAEYFERALRSKPFHFETLNNFATLHQKKGDIENAGLFYRRAIESNPSSPEARFNLGTLFIAQGKIDEAEAQLREAARLNPKFEPALATLGDVLIQKKLFEEAAGTYQAALELKPGNHIIHRNLGILYYEHLHDNKKALLHFRKTLELVPEQDFAGSIKEIIEDLSKDI
ncbi:MAG: tetratricopeptide repeat protein [Nitrospinae bacterium]|nr:tetratricopeptide repeat protein [Nitrospinota bacterium]